MYDRENIHLVEDELLFLTIDDKWAFFFFFLVMLRVKIKGKCFSHASFEKKESFKLEKQILSDIK